MLEDYFIYNAILLICPLLAYVGVRYKSRALLVVAYLILGVFGVVRYDIGNDYMNYYNMFEIIPDQFEVSGFSSILIGWEPVTLFTGLIFRGFSDSQVWCIGIYWVLSVYLLYRINKDHDSHVAGMTVFILYGAMFFLFDVIRQGLAIMIVLYAMKFVEKNKFKYCMYVVLAACCHYSALIMLPGCFLINIKPHKYLWVAIIVLLTCGFYLKIWSGLINVIFENIPFYSIKYENADHQQEMQEVSSGLGILLKAVSAILIILCLDKQRSVYINSLFWGTAIFLLGGGNYNIERMSLYFLYSIVISLPIVLKSVNRRSWGYLILLGFALTFEKSLVHEPRGNTPYKTIFSDDFSNHRFRTRS